MVGDEQRSENLLLYMKVHLQMLGARYAGDGKKEDELLDRLDVIWDSLTGEDLLEANKWSAELSRLLP